MGFANLMAVGWLAFQLSGKAGTEGERFTTTESAIMSSNTAIFADVGGL